jgi:hypothetical protein
LAWAILSLLLSNQEGIAGMAVLSVFGSFRVPPLVGIRT